MLIAEHCAATFLIEAPRLLILRNALRRDIRDDHESSSSRPEIVEEICGRQRVR
jgi:hypothetical protein